MFRFRLRSLFLATAVVAVLAASVSVQRFPTDRGDDVFIYFEPVARVVTIFRDGYTGRLYIGFLPIRGVCRFYHLGSVAAFACFIATSVQ